MAKAKKNSALSLEEKLEQALVPVEEQPYEIPDNWCWTKNNIICQLGDGIKCEGDTLPYLEVKYLRGVKEAEILSKGKLIEAGAKVILVDGENSGEVFDIHENGYMGSTFKKLVMSKGVYDKYLLYFIHSNKDLLRNNKTGSAIPHLNKKLFFDLNFPLPPMAEQQRIVEQIESLFAKLDEAKDKVREVLDCYETRRASILHRALNGELTIGWRERNKIDGFWDEIQLGDITDIKSSKRVYKEDYVEEGIPFFRSSEVVDLYDTGITEPIYFITEEKYDEIRREKGVPEEGNLLVTSVGTIGKTWIVDDRKFYYKDGNLTEVVKNDRLDMKFLQMFIMSEEFNHQVIDTVSGSAYNALTIVKFKKIKIKLPCIEEQKEIVSLVGTLLEKEQQVRESGEQVIAKIDLMKKAILAKAFRGELGTNNPEEESAVELLRSILADA